MDAAPRLPPKDHIPFLSDRLPFQLKELFDDAGLDTVGVLPFEPAVRDLNPAEFVRVALSEGMGARLVVAGEDFRFGKDRAGDVAVLADLAGRMGFSFELIRLIEGNGPLSSIAASTLLGKALTPANQVPW